MRDLMMKGQLELPAKELFLANFGPEAAKLLSQMFRALWLNYLANEGGISGPYWLEKFANVKTFNNIIRILSDNNWVICVTSSAAKFSSITLNVNKLLSYVSPDELTYIRAKHKYAKYLLTCDLDDSYDDLVRINGAIKVTGLNRPGMAQSAKTQFYYDAEFANPFKDAIIRNVNKGMSKVREMYSTMTFNNADYDAVATEIVEDLLSQPQMFNMGANYLDSRGRAIKAGLAKIANPIGFKDFRAMMTIPADKRNVATLAGLEAIYLFIAELNGYKAGTVSGKLQFGKDCYESRTLPEFNDSTVYEIIWLNRLYNEVENFLIVIEINMLEAHFKEPLTNYYWSVPIELDASA
ncbi:MAG: hypothetical protein JHC33_11800, partial [Ignisphaera sp.]|nr:hypothetical protein [Ignisphaera sp.]